MVEEVKQDDMKGDGVRDSYMPASSPVSDISIEMKPSVVHGRKSGPTRKSTKGGWTKEEDELLRKVVRLHNGKNWKKIAEVFPGRTDVQCLHRWQKVLDPELIKGPWTKEEDDLIIELVKTHGSKNWSGIAKSLTGRIGKQCRERWHNHLNPAIKKEAWTAEEEATLIRAHRIYGNKWAEIAKLIPGRADNSIKNHWNCSMKKRLDTFASGPPGHPHRLPTVDLNNSARQARCPKADPVMQSKKYPIPLDQKLAADRHFMTSNMDLVHQSASSGRLNLDLQLIPPGDSKCFRVVNQPALTIDSKCIRGEVEPMPKEDSKCAALEIHHHQLFNKQILKSPRRSQGDGFDKSDLALGDKSRKFKETPLSSLPVCDLSETDRVEGANQVPTTPLYCAAGNFGPLCSAPLQLMDKERSISTENLSRLEGYTQKTHSSVHCSAPSDLSSSLACNPSSPMTILRNLAKSFETPSIIRKRVRQSSEPLFVESFHKQTANARESDGVSDFLVRSKRVQNVLDSAYAHQNGSDSQVDLKRTNSRNDGQFYRSCLEYLKHETSGTTKSVARRLEDEFDMELDGSSSGVR